MNTYLTLPDRISYLLLAFGIIAVVVYIKVTIDDIKAAQRERAMRGLRSDKQLDALIERLEEIMEDLFGRKEQNNE